MNAKPENKDKRAEEPSAEQTPQAGAEVDAEVGAEAEAGNGAAQAPSDAAQSPEDQLEAKESDAAARARLEAEVAALKDQLLRALAEVENTRRRTQRERDEALKFATAPLAKDLLGVADNLRRAIESVPEDAAGNETVAKLLAGIELTEKALLEAFEKHRIRKLVPLGEKLDPHRHEALFEVPGSDQPSGTVVQVVEPGYLLDERLLRPARVGVAKNG